MKSEKFDVTGMSCSACVAAVEKSVTKVQGVKTVQVNLLTNSMSVEFEEGQTGVIDIELAVQKVGYEARLKSIDKKFTSEAEKNPTEAAQLKMAFRWKVSLGFLIPLLYVSMGRMIGLPAPEILSNHSFFLLQGLIQFLLATPIFLVNNKYFTSGFKSLYHRSPNMDSLIALGSSAAYLYGVYQILLAAYSVGSGLELVHGNLYFESGATILTLITLGKYLESRSKSKTSDAIKKLMELRPQTAILLKDNIETEISIEDVKTGDILVVRSGGLIPVDGIILNGSGVADESALTGESMPVEKKVGDKLMTASILSKGFVQIQASAVGENTTLSKIISLVEEASSSKAPISKLADQISAWFVPAVIAVSVLTFVVWMFLGAGVDQSLAFAISVMVISCPCALGLATPVAIMVGTGKGASIGILFKNASVLEQSHQVNTVIFDKTGTLTTGKPVVKELITSAFFPADKLLTIAASLEKPSEHPLADAILKEAEKRGLVLDQVTDFEVLPGMGVRAKIADRIYMAGNRKLLEDAQVAFKNLDKKADDLAAKGHTPLWIANGTEALGLISVADEIRPESKEIIEGLKNNGIQTVMLTGDHKSTALAVQQELLIDRMFAEVLPHQKEEVVRQLQSEGKVVAMVGDGINDAPALVRADIGIAMGNGRDVAIESADIALMHPGINVVPDIFSLSKVVIQHIRQNLFWAFFYNVLGIPLAAGVFYSTLGWQLSPSFAAAAMSLSSVTVVLNALRINAFGRKKKETNTSEVKIMNKEILVEGMTCGHCVMRVKKALEGVEGVSNVEVDLNKKTATLQASEAVSDAALKTVVEDSGYEVKSIN